MPATANARTERDNELLTDEARTKNHDISGWEIDVPPESGATTAVAPQCHTGRPVQISAGSYVVFGANETPHDAAQGMCFMNKHRYFDTDLQCSHFDMQHLSDKPLQFVVDRLMCYGHFYCEPPKEKGHRSKLFVEASGGFRLHSHRTTSGTFIRYEDDASCFVVDGKPMKPFERMEVHHGSVVLCRPFCYGQLLAHGVDSVYAAGAPRDPLRGVDAKDYDVILHVRFNQVHLQGNSGKASAPIDVEVTSLGGKKEIAVEIQTPFDLYKWVSEHTSVPFGQSHLYMDGKHVDLDDKKFPTATPGSKGPRQAILMQAPCPYFTPTCTKWMDTALYTTMAFGDDVRQLRRADEGVYFDMGFFGDTKLDYMEGTSLQVCPDFGAVSLNNRSYVDQISFRIVPNKDNALASFPGRVVLDMLLYNAEKRVKDWVSVHHLKVKLRTPEIKRYDYMPCDVRSFRDSDIFTLQIDGRALQVAKNGVIVDEVKSGTLHEDVNQKAVRTAPFQEEDIRLSPFLTLEHKQRVLVNGAPCGPCYDHLSQSLPPGIDTGLLAGGKLFVEGSYGYKVELVRGEPLPLAQLTEHPPTGFEVIKVEFNSVLDPKEWKMYRLGWFLDVAIQKDALVIVGVERYPQFQFTQDLHVGDIIIKVNTLGPPIGQFSQRDAKDMLLYIDTKTAYEVDILRRTDSKRARYGKGPSV